MLEGRFNSSGGSNGQENEQESKKENRSPRLFKGGCERTSRSFQGQNPGRQNCKADQEDGWLAPSEGAQARYRPRASALVRASKPHIAWMEEPGWSRKLVRSRAKPFSHRCWSMCRGW